MIDAVPKSVSSSAFPLKCMGSGCCRALGWLRYCGFRHAYLLGLVFCSQNDCQMIFSSYQGQLYTSRATPCVFIFTPCRPGWELLSYFERAAFGEFIDF